MKDDEAPSSGARWRRIDFHLHSPGVDSFTSPGGMNHDSAEEREKFADDYAGRLASEGIEVAALTDYNGIREPWFTALKAAAEKRGIVMLPGVELSLSEGKGIHVLAIFREGTEPREVNECLRSMDKLPGRSLVEGRVHHEIDLRDHLTSALRSLRDRFNCLLIAAHCDDDKGIIKHLGPKRAAQLVRDVGMDALEHAGSSRAQLKSTGVLSAEALGNLAFVEFSDPKNLTEVGGKRMSDGTARGTWLKLSATDLDAIRLAFHDPQTRLTTRTPKPANHARIIRAQVSGSGFLGNVDIAWNADLNTLVGGRGTGKSAILESVRYALDLTPYSDPDYRRETVRAALGSGGEVTLLVERPGETAGKRYRVRRVLGQSAEVYDADSGELLGVPPREVFGPSAEPIVLLQREIQEVSRDNAFRLKLLDVLVGDVVAAAAHTVKGTVRELEQNAGKLRDADLRFSEKAELEEKRRSINREIQFYVTQGITGKLSKFTALQEDEARLDRAVAFVRDETEGAWLAALHDLVSKINNLDSGLTAAMSSEAARLAPARAALQNLRVGIVQAEAALVIAFTAARTSMDEVEGHWRDVVAPLQEELHRLQQEIGATLDSDRYLQLERERAALDPKLAQADAAGVTAQGLYVARSKLLRRLSDERLAENRLRRETADAVNLRLDGKLRISIVYKGQKDAWRSVLAEFFKGSRLPSDVIDRFAQPEANDGAQIAASATKGADDLVATFGLTEAFAERACRWLLDDHSNRLRRLEMLAPSDAVDVRLIVDGKEQSLETLSIGQRATAILLLLFALEGRLLILDQPEDDLDNRFVYEDIVTLLRDQKGLTAPTRRRQVIAATHNPNIPVLGDAEQVLVLVAKDSKAKVLTRASIDDATVRQHVRTILEGGQAAFRRRAEKYGGVVLAPADVVGNDDTANR
jgi:chromosome segregation protein